MRGKNLDVARRVHHFFAIIMKISFHSESVHKGYLISISHNYFWIFGRSTDTHAFKNMHIPTVAYFINTLDSQSSGRGRGGPTYFKAGELFYKICSSLYANFQKNLIRYVLWKVSIFALIFYVIRTVCEIYKITLSRL